MDTKTEVNLKESNRFAIWDHITQNNYKRIHGTKLEALYKLIQLKGYPITGDSEHAGVKALQFYDNNLIAMVKTSYKKGSFFPCKLVTIHLTVKK